MTTKTTALPVTPGEQFPELPPRDDMLNVIYLHEPGHVPALRRHYGSFDTTLVASEIPIGWNTSQREGLQQPDLFIAFGVDRAAIIAHKGYDISVRGKAPDFVLEIASENTAQNDETNKREGYAEFGIPEYWRFDHTGGEFYASALAGDWLVAGEYRPITIHRVDDNHYWGHSEVLNLDVCWENGQLRWYDPVARRYLPTYDDEADGRIEEHTARSVAESERDTERDARLAAESERDEERDARLAAESERDEERDARRAAEERVRQLREELARLRQG